MDNRFEELILEIEKISNKLEYEDNLNFAYNTLHLYGSDAKKWALSATEEQIKTNNENKKRLRRQKNAENAVKNHVLAKGRRALELDSSLSTNELSNLMEKLESLSI